MSGVFTFEERTCPRCTATFDALDFWDDDTVCGDCGRADYAELLRVANEGRPYTITSIGGACPTQAEGVWIDGNPYYFRARHGDWSLKVAESPDGDAVAGRWIAGGDDPDHGWMEVDAVLAILDREVAR